MDSPMSSSDLLLHIKKNYSGWSLVEQRLADYISSSIGEIPDKTVTELSDICDVSEASIIRFSKKMGYKGFHHMKIELARSVNSQISSEFPEEVSNTLQGLVERSYKTSITNIKNTYDHIDMNQLEQAVTLITRCNQVNIFAAGNSLPICHDFVYRLGRIGIRAVTSDLPEKTLLLAQNMQKGDIALAFSHSGDSILVNEALKIVFSKKLPIICMSNFVKSPIMKWADISIVTSVHNSMFEGGQYLTRLTEYAVFDLLFYMLFYARKDKNLDMISQTESAQSLYSL